MAIAEPVGKAAQPRETKEFRLQRRRGTGGLRWLVFVLMVGSVAGAGWYYREELKAQWLGDKASGPELRYEAVRRLSFVETVTEDGNMASAANIDVKCMLEGGSQILWIVPDGTQVKKGDVIVKLDASALDTQILTQKRAAQEAKLAFEQAKTDCETASIAIQEYEDGKFKQEEQIAAQNIVIAQENLRNAQNTLEHSTRMFRKGYINQLQLESNRFAVRRAELELDAANTAHKVLTKFTREKTLTDLRGVFKTAEVRRAEKQLAYEMEQTKAKRLDDQLALCIIKAPQSGMVIYANERSWRGSQQSQIEEGAQVRQAQTIIQLPDLTQMQVKVLVHETKINRVQPKMNADIVVFGKRTRGKVANVASQPEAAGWPPSQVKQYAVIVSIDEKIPDLDLKPGMTAKVEITIQEHRDVTAVSLLAVAERGSGYFAYVKADNEKGYLERPVKVGASNDEVIQIVDGLKEGEEVVINPRQHISEAREVVKEERKYDGAGSNSPAGAPSTPGAGGSGTPGTGPGPQNSAGGAPLAQVGKGADKTGKSGRGGNLMDMDKNKDGKVTKDEVPEGMQPFFDRMDTNKDGGIDAAEAAEARRRMQERQNTPASAMPPGA